MFFLFTYAAANARIQANIASLLQENTWEQLLASSSTEEFLSVLNSTPYRSITIEATRNIELIEKKLTSFLADRYLDAAPFLRGKSRELLDWLWRPFEIDNIIMILRGIHNNVSGDQLQVSLIDPGTNSDINWKRLQGISSLQELIIHLSNTIHGRFYARAIDNALNEYERQNNVFVLEVSLYLSYYRRLRSLIDTLPPAERPKYNQFIGNLIDSRNILWAYRYKIFFRFSPETILAYTLPGTSRITASVIRKAATGTPPATLIREVWDEELPDMHLLEDRKQRDAVVNLELIFRRYLYCIAQRTLGEDPLNPGLLLAYIMLIESEVYDLISILEGIANEWSQEMIRENLIRSPGGEK